MLESGELNDKRLTALATELLAVGCPFVVAIREALIKKDPRHFFFADEGERRECA